MVVSKYGSTPADMIKHQMPLMRDHHDEGVFLPIAPTIIVITMIVAYSSNYNSHNNDDGDWYNDYYMSCSNVNNNNIAAFTWNNFLNYII